MKTESLRRGSFLSEDPLVDESKALRRPHRRSPEDKEGGHKHRWNGTLVRLWQGSAFIFREFEDTEKIKPRGSDAKGKVLRTKTAYSMPRGVHWRVQVRRPF